MKRKKARRRMASPRRASSSRRQPRAAVPLQQNPAGKAAGKKSLAYALNAPLRYLARNRLRSTWGRALLLLVAAVLIDAAFTYVYQRFIPLALPGHALGFLERGYAPSWDLLSRAASAFELIAVLYVVMRLLGSRVRLVEWSYLYGAYLFAMSVFANLLMNAPALAFTSYFSNFSSPGATAQSLAWLPLLAVLFLVWLVVAIALFIYAIYLFIRMIGIAAGADGWKSTVIVIIAFVAIAVINAVLVALVASLAHGSISLV